MTAEKAPGDLSRRNPRLGRPTYIHELDDWPNFRWDPEAITVVKMVDFSYTTIVSHS